MRRERKRARSPQHPAEQAWGTVTSAMHTTGGAARTATRFARGFAGVTPGRIGDSTDEARRRATAALDAIAGRRPSRPWGWIAGAAAIGAAVGWGTAKFGRRAGEEMSAQLAEAGLTGEREDRLGTLATPPSPEAAKPGMSRHVPG